MIRLDGLTKRYPNQREAAVEELTLDIPKGRIVAFVGPSGCGKTTTMKLINRLIEPTSGRIHLDGRDVTDLPVHLLRRQIGYAIQQSGLFPHRTVADNIATVPRLLGWDSRRVADRVDELLTMVGLPPQTYRGRYPKQLSGGQQQRVGVARALGGDPDVLLMDEPFGAIDPLNREALQNEFLRIQGELHKTIVFVTHDMDEAVKMGDLIAIFADSGQVLQYDTPERILAEPADAFVADFVGAGAAVKRLSLTRLDRLQVPQWPHVTDTADPVEYDAAAAQLGGSGNLLVLDAAQRPTGWLPAAQATATTAAAADDDQPAAEDADGTGTQAEPAPAVFGPEHTLFDVLDHMLSANVSAVAVVDGSGRYRGVLEMDTVRELIHAEPSRTAENTDSSGQLQEA